MTKTSKPSRPWCAALVVRADAEQPSNYRSLAALDRWLKTHNIPAIAGIDTRALTARIRENGMPHGVIAHVGERQVRYRGTGETGARISRASSVSISPRT